METKQIKNINCPIHNCKYQIFCLVCYKRHCAKCYDPHNTSGYTIYFHGICSSGMRIYINIKTFIFKLQMPKTIFHKWFENQITLCNPFNNKQTNIKIHDNIDIASDSISFQNRIFIMGEKVYQVDLAQAALIAKAEMITKKTLFTLCISTSYIYSIGGHISGVIRDCEKYNVYENKWYALPELAIPRRFCAAFPFNYEYVYAIGGSGESYELSSIEKLDMSRLEKWDLLDVAHEFFTPRHNMHGMQINEKEAIFFGGYNNCYYADSYILDLSGKEAKCTKGPSLPQEADFYVCSAPMIINGNMYCVSNKRDLYCLKMKSLNWDILTN